MSKKKATEKGIGKYLLVKPGHPAMTVVSVHDTLEEVQAAHNKARNDVVDTHIVFLPDELPDTQKVAEGAE